MNMTQKIEDVGPFKYGKGLPERDRLPGEIPVYGSGGIVGRHHVPYVNQRGIIIGRKGSIGTVYFSEEPFFPIDTVFFVDRVAENTNLKFYYYFLKSIGLERLNSDAAVPGLSRSHVHRMNFNFPSLKNQKKIAAILSAYDDLIENNSKRIKILETMAEEIYKEWFVRMRFPRYESTKNVKNIPIGWRLKRLPAVAKIQYGYPFQSNRFNDQRIGTKLVRIRNIPRSQSSDYTDEIVDAKYIVNNGDLLVGMDGEFHINHWYDDRAYLVQRVCKLTPIDSLYRGYISFAIRSPIKFYESILMGATVGHLGAKHLNSIEILMPPKTTEYLEVFNNLIDQITDLALSNKNLSNTKDLLLSRLMSGKINVEDLDIEYPPSMVIEKELVHA
jgi:type I restriction enzyme, S subunit